MTLVPDSRNLSEIRTSQAALENSAGQQIVKEDDMSQNKPATPISRRKEVFGLGYVPDRLQAAHDQSLAISNKTVGESEQFSQYMNGLRVRRTSKSSRSKTVAR